MAPLGRRAFLRGVRNLSLLAALPAPALADLLAAAQSATGASGAGVFFDAAGLRSLRALCQRLIPGPPEDPDPGALEAGAAEYIDLMLGAFEERPARIFAGGPFSSREGGGPNYFARFLELDALEERIWRTRIEGSRGLPEREWNGPVVGWQERYTRGLALLDEAARGRGGEGFAALSAERAGAVLEEPDEELSAFLDLAFHHVCEGTYGAPEYGGNRNRVGWRYTRWPGDHQPHVWSDEQLALPDADQAEAAARARRNALAYRRRYGVGSGGRSGS